MATAYVRIIVAKNPANSNLGTFDLRLSAAFNMHDGMNVTTDPIFSYRSDGKLYIFSKDDQLSNCSYLDSSEYELWEWSFSCNDAELTTFRTYLQGIVNIYSWNSATGRYVCTLKSPYNNFQMGERDSFTEVATWCEKLGDTILKSRVTGENAYQATLPSALVDKYYHQLEIWLSMNNGYDLP